MLHNACKAVPITVVFSDEKSGASRDLHGCVFRVGAGDAEVDIDI